jgi:hypothetical protein
MLFPDLGLTFTVFWTLPCKVTVSTNEAFAPKPVAETGVSAPLDTGPATVVASVAATPPAATEFVVMIFSSLQSKGTRNKTLKICSSLTKNIR